MCRDRVTRGVRMQLLRVTALAVAICVLAPPPVSAQISPNAAWSCEFANSATACGFYLQAAASNRAAVVGPGRDGPTAVQLTTHLGDINIAGSDSNERADLALSPSSRYCNQGQDEWWAHSLMFPPSYVAPPVAAVWNWGALFDFHNSSSGGGQPNFMVYATPKGLELHMAGGANTVNRPTDPGYYGIAIGPITQNVWYDFVYHVKWSSGAGLTRGAVAQQSSSTVASGSVISQSPAAGTSVAKGSAVNLVVSTGPNPVGQVAVPNVVGQTQATATSAITGAGLTRGAVAHQSSSMVASGSVIREPRGGRRCG